LKLAFVGCVGEGRRSAETLLAMGERLDAIFTLRPERAVRVSGAVPWEDLAQAHEIPLHYVRNINDEEPVRILRELEPDLIFCVGWTQLLRKPILEIPRIGCIGFHASLLPRYRGRAPVNWAIINGEKETGNTMMLLDDGVDTGDVIAQRRFPIEEHDTCATVYDKVARSEEEMLREVMPLIHAGRMPRRAQNHAEATVMPKRTPADGIIDWSRTTRQLYDWVRALTHPYPGAFTTVEGRRVWVWKASIPPAGPGPAASAGHWRLAGDPPRLLAGTADGELGLDRVQAEDEDEMDGAEFGRRLPAAGARAGEDR